jgi:penicillin-binding protein 1C
VSDDEKISYCTACLPEYGYKKKEVMNHEPEMLAYFEQHFLPYEKIPDHNPNCEKLYEYGAPEITSPSNNMSYLLDKKETNQLMLACQTSIDVKKVYWYVNNQLLKEVNANEKIFIQPEEGILKISCSDDKGRNTNVTVTVKYVDM